MRYLYVVCLLVATINSCTHKSKVSSFSGNYIIIGYTGGFAGNIFYSDYLLINDNGCARSSNPVGTKVPSDNSQFVFNKVQSRAKFDSVKYLLHSIPAELLIRRNADFGIAQPDAGGLDVRASIDGIAYRWGFESDLSNCSADVKQFAQNVSNELK